MKRCDNGHFFEPEKHSSCPMCGVPGLDLSVTKPKRRPAADGDQRPPDPERPVRSGGTLLEGDEEQRTRGRDQKADPRREPGETVGHYRKKIGIDPVVGWLVCVKGPDRGRDFRIRSEKNFIGRGEAMDVCLASDDRISRENHAAVSYDPKKSAFRLHPGEGRGLVYLNDEEVSSSTILQSHDCIELGETTLLFVPLCGEAFRWD